MGDLFRLFYTDEKALKGTTSGHTYIDEFVKPSYNSFVMEYMASKLILDPKHVLVNGDYTTVVWSDGSHTVVKKAADDEYDFEKAILYAIVKRCSHDNTSCMRRYLKKFDDVMTVKSLKPKKKKSSFAAEVVEKEESDDGIKATLKAKPATRDEILANIRTQLDGAKVNLFEPYNGGYQE